MEVVRKRFRLDFRKIFTVFYFVAFAIYLAVGLTPAKAQYEVTGNIEVPKVALKSDVTELELSEHKLNTPDTIVGSYAKAENKTLLIGHSTTVFRDLYLVAKGDDIIYNSETYKILTRVTLRKDKIDMEKLLAPAGQPTIVVMTCAGEIDENLDASHRLLVTAVKKE